MEGERGDNLGREWEGRREREGRDGSAMFVSLTHKQLRFSESVGDEERGRGREK